MIGTDRILTDKELDALLAKASVPKVPMGFEQRLAQRVANEVQSNVVQFPLKAKAVASTPWRWPVPAALAASLIIGIWLGAQGLVGNIIDGTTTETAMTNSTGDFGPAGLDDISDIVTDTAS